MKESVVEIGESIVRSVILHQVGNRLREEALILADECFDITEDISNLVLSGYLRGIVSDKNKFVLSHESDLVLNDVVHHTSKYFSENESFVALSKKLAQHLYTSAHHPNIASGDLFVILFDRLKVDGVYKSAIGIYKSEAKQQYLSTKTDGGAQKLEVFSGINPDLIDKGALIINGAESFYAIDRLSGRTKYWIDDFLKAKQIPSEATKSAVAISLIEKIRETIESPTTQQEFYREVIELCSNKDKVLSGEIKNISEKYISDDTWDTELERIVERKGLVDSSEISVSGKKIQTRLRKKLNQISLGHDIALIVPEGLLFNNVNFKIDGKSIIINLILESENG